ncbi:MAG TPA: FprA family A-type flavoprotein, partial [Prevotella sp.]|nr:FprA family A-type flavoprotein [Prevotella sp.]
WNETKLHYEALGEPVDMKQAITPEVKAQCEALGKAMAEKLLAE